MEGWIKLFRKILEWDWYDDPNTKSVFLDFVLNASIEDKKWKGIDIKRGQLIVGRKELSKRLGISEQSLRTSITRLKSTSEITSKSTNKFTIITVVNYEKYQNKESKSTSTSTSYLTNEQPAINQQSTTSKEEKKRRSKEIKRVIEKIYTPPNLTNSDFQEIAEKYNTTIGFVQFQYDKMVTWAESRPDNPKLRGRNWKMTLMSFVRDDMLKIKQDYGKQNSEVSI